LVQLKIQHLFNKSFLTMVRNEFKKIPGSTGRVLIKTVLGAACKAHQYALLNGVVRTDADNSAE
jgi:hypothetical protein